MASICSDGKWLNLRGVFDRHTKHLTLPTASLPPQIRTVSPNDEAERQLEVIAHTDIRSIQLTDQMLITLQFQYSISRL